MSSLNPVMSGWLPACPLVPLDARTPPGKLRLGYYSWICANVIHRFRWVDFDLTVAKRKKPYPLHACVHLTLQPQTQQDFGMTLIFSI